MDAAIRKIELAEHADMAARRTVETGEVEPNPHPEGTTAHRDWKVAYERFLVAHSAADMERSA